MADQWFRFYNSAVNDPKVQRLSAALFRFWVNSLCLASNNAGKLPELVDLCFCLRLSENQANSYLRELISCELIDDGGDGTLTPHNWDDRQFKSDASKERQQRYRDRHRNDARDVTATVTVTAQETDTESDTEQNRESKKEPAAVAAPARSKDASLFPTKTPKKKTRCPDGFPGELERVYAEREWTSLGRCDLVPFVSRETEKFRDHHSASATLSANWPASWRMWVRNAIEFNRGPPREQKEHKILSILGQN